MTKLEHTGLLCNIHYFRHLLKHHYFEVLLDQQAIENLQKGKKEPTTD